MASRSLFPPPAPCPLTIPVTGIPDLKSSKVSWSSRSFLETWTSGHSRVNIPYSLSSHLHHGVHTCQALLLMTTVPFLLSLKVSALPAPRYLECAFCRKALLTLPPLHPGRVQEFRAKLTVCSFTNSSKTVSSLRAGLYLLILAYGILDEVEDQERGWTNSLMPEWRVW